MFYLEAKDEKVLDSPEATIIQNGGYILFVELSHVGIVGTCALLKTGRTNTNLQKWEFSKLPVGEAPGNLF